MNHAFMLITLPYLLKTSAHYIMFAYVKVDLLFMLNNIICSMKCITNKARSNKLFKHNVLKHFNEFSTLTWTNHTWFFTKHSAYLSASLLELNKYKQVITSGFKKHFSKKNCKIWSHRPHFGSFVLESRPLVDSYDSRCRYNGLFLCSWLRDSAES